MNLSDFEILIDPNVDLLEDAKRLRAEVFDRELHWVVARNGVDFDEFDATATHIVVLNRTTNTIVATSRVLDSECPWMCEQYFKDLIPRGFGTEDKASGVEVSRFAVRCDARGWLGGERESIADILLHGLLEHVSRRGRDAIFMVISKQVFRFLKIRGYRVDKLGKEVLMSDGVTAVFSRMTAVGTQIKPVRIAMETAW